MIKERSKKASALDTGKTGMAHPSKAGKRDTTADTTWAEKLLHGLRNTETWASSGPGERLSNAINYQDLMRVHGQETWASSGPGERLSNTINYQDLMRVHGQETWASSGPGERLSNTINYQDLMREYGQETWAS